MQTTENPPETTENLELLHQDSTTEQKEQVIDFIHENLEFLTQVIKKCICDLNFGGASEQIEKLEALLADIPFSITIRDTSSKENILIGDSSASDQLFIDSDFDLNEQTVAIKAPQNSFDFASKSIEETNEFLSFTKDLAKLKVSCSSAIDFVKRLNKNHQIERMVKEIYDKIQAANSNVFVLDDYR